MNTSGSVFKVCASTLVGVHGLLWGVSSESKLADFGGSFSCVGEIVVDGVDGLLVCVEILQLLQTQIVLALLE